MSTFFYFAYGSNMLTERLRARCPSACARSVGFVRGYDLLFAKRSIDGSGKAALIMPSDRASMLKVFGVLFEISEGDRIELDRCEGDGYDRDGQVSVNLVDGGGPQQVTSYIAQPAAIEAGLEPYEWYMALVIAGARQHGLPEDYIGCLDKVPSVEDSHANRPRRIEALGVLKAAGHPL